VHRLNPNPNSVPPTGTPSDGAGSAAASPPPYRPRQGGVGACAFCGATMLGRFCSDCGRSRSDVLPALPARPDGEVELDEVSTRRVWWPPSFEWAHSSLALPVGIAITIVTMVVSAFAASSQGPVVHIKAIATAAVSSSAPAQVAAAPTAKPSPSAATSSRAAGVAGKAAPIAGPNAATTTAPAVDFADHPIDDPDVAAKSNQTIYIGALKVRHPKTAPSGSAAPTVNACSAAASAVADVYTAIVSAMGEGDLTKAAPAIATGVVTIRAAAKTATDAGQAQAITAVAARGQDLHDFMVGVSTATWPNLVSTSFDHATDSLDATCNAT
jgi:hypothetical protein